MSKLNAFKKLIREEVRQVIREELRAVLLESTNNQRVNNVTYKETIKEGIKKNAVQTAVNETVTTDPIQALLAETARSMDPEAYNTLIGADSSMAQNFSQIAVTNGLRSRSDVPVVSTVTDMLASAQPANDISQVQIDAVPDFRGVMKALKEKGSI